MAPPILVELRGARTPIENGIGKKLAAAAYLKSRQRCRSLPAKANFRATGRPGEQGLLDCLNGRWIGDLEPQARSKPDPVSSAIDSEALAASRHARSPGGAN
jgi:hypothetical protein